MRQTLMHRRMCWCIAGAVVLALSASACHYPHDGVPQTGTVQEATAADSAPSATGKDVRMSNDQVIQEIRDKDWSILDAPSRIGPDSAEAVASLLHDEDPEVRELSVYCLNMIGGPKAKEGLFKALRDESSMVRAAASRSLHNHTDKQDIPMLFQELSGNADEYVREQIALIIGRVSEPSYVQSLSTLMEIEKDSHARHAITLAMTRLGDGKQKQRYRGLLQAPDVASRVDALRDFEYLQQAEYLSDILPLLDDRRDAVNVAPGGHLYYIRVCDMVVNVLHKALSITFPFEVDPVKRYSDEELKKAKSALAGM